MGPVGREEIANFVVSLTKPGLSDCRGARFPCVAAPRHTMSPLLRLGFSLPTTLAVGNKFRRAAAALPMSVAGIRVNTSDE